MHKYIYMDKKDFGYSTSINNYYAVIGNPSFEKFNTGSTFPILEEGSVDVYKYEPSASTGFIFSKTIHRKDFDSYTLYLETNTTSSDGVSGSNEIITELFTSSSVDYELYDSSSILISDYNSVKTLASDFGRCVDMWESMCVIGSSRIYYTYLEFDNVIRKENGVVEIHDLSLDSSYLTSIRLSDVTSPHNNESFSFGRSVSINEDFIAIGSPYSNGGTGLVFLFQSGSSGYSFHSTLSASLSSEILYGECIKLDKNYNKLIVGNGNITNLTSSAYLYEYVSGSWNEVKVFQSSREAKNLNFISYPQYDEVLTEPDGFGNSVAIYCSSADDITVAIGSPYDRTFKEYSGSACYKGGSVYIFEMLNCVLTASITQSSRQWDLTKIYGDKDAFKFNRFGHSVSIYDSNLVISSPKFLSEFSSSYIENTLFKSEDCDDVLENDHLGMFYIYNKDENGWNNVYAKYKPVKKYGYPFNFYAYSTCIFDKNVIVGNPVVITDSNRKIHIPEDKDILSLNLNGNFDIFSLLDFELHHHVGNVFYKTGKMIFSNTGSVFDYIFETDTSDDLLYDIRYNSKQSMYEKEIICTIEPGEFNYSTNPSAYSISSSMLDLNKNGKFDFEDCDKILRGIFKKFNLDESWWTLFQFENPQTFEDRVESSMFKFYVSSSFENKNNVTLNNDVLTPNEFYHISKNLDSKLDINGDGLTDYNDIYIIWKYFTNTLNPINFNNYISSKSIGVRHRYSSVYDYIKNLTGKNVVPRYLENFNDRYISGSLFNTGSYLTPYITTIGLYNGLDLIAVAKLGTPIKNEGIFPLNFMIRFDI
jgi:hypothetical protein